MTEPAAIALVVAVVTALPPTVVAWLAFKQSKANAAKAEETGKKVDVVHVLANSNLAEMKSSLAVANEKIIGLEKLISSLAQKHLSKKPRSTRT